MAKTTLISADLRATGVTPGSYTNTDLTVDAAGRITLAANGSAGGVGTHVLLDATVHTDTLTGTVVRGDLVVGNATPKWSRLGIGAAGRYFGSNGTDAAWTAGSALTKVDDTNVTLTLGGTPTTALLAASSLTLGWTGTLAVARGGTASGTALGGFNTLSPLTTRGDVLTRDASDNVRLALGASGTFLKAGATDPAWAAITAADVGSGAALTRTNDANVTLALGGTPTSALLAATSLTLGWSGTLAIARGGTGQATQTAAFNALAPTTTRGDLIVMGATDDVRLAVGASARLLQSDGTDPSWVALSGDATIAAGGALTLASTISAGGPTGSATVAPVITYDAKGRLTAVSSATVTPAVGSITGLGTGVGTWLATPSSANLLAAVTDETGTGALVFGSSPTIVTPTIASFTNATHDHTNAAGGGQVPIATGVSGLGTGVATFLGTPSSANLLAAVTDETGTGALVFATSPTLVTPLLGTPTSGTLTNCTGLPVSTGISGLGTGVATFLATPSSANLISAVTDETGTGVLVFGTAPTFTTSIITPIVYGSASTAGGLTLRANDDDFLGTVTIDSAATLWPSMPSFAAGTTATQNGLTISPTFTASPNSGIQHTWNGLTMSPVITSAPNIAALGAYHTALNFTPTVSLSNSTQVFAVNVGGTFTSTATPILSQGTFYAASLYTSGTNNVKPAVVDVYNNFSIAEYTSGATGITYNGMRTVVSQPTVRATGSGNFTATKVTAVYSDIVVTKSGSGVPTITTRAGLDHVAGTIDASGVIATDVAVNVANTNITGVTNAYAVQSAITSGANAYFLRDTGGAQSSLVGKFTKYNNVTTAGYGVPAVVAAARATAQTAANASVATYTVGAADGTFVISANVLVTTSTVHSFTVTCAYTDEGNTARTITMTFSNVGGTLLTTIANAGGAVPYEGIPLHIRAKASTAITIATAAGGTYTTVTYNVDGLIRQVS